MQTELPERKQKRNVLSFDDLLLRAPPGSAGPEGEALASVIRRKYRAALIDEFQDTDPVQYAIFAKVFRAEGSILSDRRSQAGHLQLPGADIFAYLKAASCVDNVYTPRCQLAPDPALIKRREHPSFPAGKFLCLRENRLPAGDAGKHGITWTTPDRRPPLEPPLQWWLIAAGRFADGDSFPLAKRIARPEGESGRGGPSALCGPDPCEGPLHLVWGRMNESGMSAQAYLFHGDDREEDVVAASETRFRSSRWRDVPGAGGDRRKGGWRHRSATPDGGGACGGNRGGRGRSFMPLIHRHDRSLLASRQLFPADIGTDPEQRTSRSG